MFFFFGLDASRRSKIEDAFRKLQSFIFFDGTDLYPRAQIVEYINNGGLEKFDELNQRLFKGVDGFSEYYDQIKLRYYPKKTQEISKNIEEDIPPNFISNAFYKGNSTVSRLNIFCDIPIELHIISVLWIIEFGYVLDSSLGKHSYGNRLLLANRKLPQGRTLFKRYVKQYQKWWSNGIKAAENLLKEDQNLTIINFDLKDYYHSAEIDFRRVENALVRKFPKIKNDPLHKVFKRIHEVYAEKFRKIKHPACKSNSKDKLPLPVALLSSSVLANWHLKSFDRYILKELVPTYYGRYVDDLFIVLKERVIEKLDERKKAQVVSFLKKNGVAIQKGGKHINILNYFISKYFAGFLKPVLDKKSSGLTYQITLPRLTNLKLQEEKIFVYQFDAALSPNLISRFVEEQKERSSEFRFLSDEEDETFDDFDDNIFEENFDEADVNKAKFKKLEENRFKLSVYFAKLIQRKIERGTSYKEEEVQKIDKYFKGTYILKNYTFWEKLFTLYLVSNKKKYFLELLKRIKDQINNYQISRDLIYAKNDVAKSLDLHLRYSIEMALGLYPDFLDKDFRKEILVYLNDIDEMFFRKNCFIRKHFVLNPLIHLTNKGKSGRFSLVAHDIFRSEKWEPNDFQITIKQFIPFRIKYYEASLLNYTSHLYSYLPSLDRNKRTGIDALPINKILMESFDLFFEINNPENANAKERVKLEYFVNKEQGRNGIILNELFFKNGGKSRSNIRVGLVNKYINSQDSISSLEGMPNINGERIETYYRIIDQISQIKNLDLFVMPEMALPFAFLRAYLQFSSRNQKGFISGLEHIAIDNFGFNFILTCLPVNVHGDFDAIPILRLKNHYAPNEAIKINDLHIQVPIPNPYRYDLFEWRGVYFSTYYCFELADINHRIIFYSMIDLICVPVWNKDTHYYSNIVESTCRDLHVYFIQVNTSQYGDTRVTRPVNHERRDKAKVKGGTVEDYKVTILVSDINIKELRDFQRLTYQGQKNYNQDHPSKPIKPTPPDFPYENVMRRIRNERFFDEE